MTYSVAVSGASGYAGGEILRLLADHPDFEVRTVTAHANAGQPLVAVQPHLRTYAHLTLQETTAEMLAGHDVVFLALPHGASGAIAAELAPETLVIDCGADHRLERADDWAAFYGGEYHGAWSYGVPELPLHVGHRSATGSRGRRRIAAPGCNASTVALSLAPGIRAGVIEDRDLVSVLAVGPSGAGKSLQGAPARERDPRVREPVLGRRRAPAHPRDHAGAAVGGRGGAHHLVHARARADVARHPRHVDGPHRARHGCRGGPRRLGGRLRGRAVRAAAARRAVPAHGRRRWARTPRSWASRSTRPPDAWSS